MVVQVLAELLQPWEVKLYCNVELTLACPAGRREGGNCAPACGERKEGRKKESGGAAAKVKLHPQGRLSLQVGALVVHREREREGGGRAEVAASIEYRLAQQ